MATQEEAQSALFDAVKALADSAVEYGGDHGSRMLRAAGYAYRAAVGGAESIIVEGD